MTTNPPRSEAKNAPARRPIRPGLAGSETGAAIIEFALILPLLLILIGGCFELGRAMLVYQSMIEALRGGARYLAQVPDPSCRPACALGAARAIEMTRRGILANARLSPQNVRVSPRADPPLGTVIMEAEVVLAADLLALLRLDRVLRLRASHQEARIAE